MQITLLPVQKPPATRTTVRPVKALDASWACATTASPTLAWTLRVAPNVLLIPGTSSVGHLEESLAVADVELDDELRAHLDAGA